jgi:hypothetical protein
VQDRDVPQLDPFAQEVVPDAVHRLLRLLKGSSHGRRVLTEAPGAIGATRDRQVRLHLYHQQASVGRDDDEVRLSFDLSLMLRDPK